MTPTQTLTDFPIFANSGKKRQPDSEKYAAGFVPADVLPAEWLNWEWNTVSNALSSINAGIKSIEQELNTVLEESGQTPSIGTNGQVLEAIKKLFNSSFTRKTVTSEQLDSDLVLKGETKGNFVGNFTGNLRGTFEGTIRNLIDMIHPVGSVFTTKRSPTNGGDPNELFGGEWKRIKDCVIVAAGDEFEAGTSGGASKMTLTERNLPSHTHNLTGGISSNTSEISLSSSTSGISLESNGAGATTAIVSSNPRVESIVNTGYLSYSQKSSTLGFSDGNKMQSYGDINLSAHSHTVNDSGHNHTVSDSGHSHSHNFQIENSSEMKGESFNIMNPYKVYYCWERIA